MNSQPQNLEFRNKPENFHPWHCHVGLVKEKILFRVCLLCLFVWTGALSLKFIETRSVTMNIF